MKSSDKNPLTLTVPCDLNNQSVSYTLYLYSTDLKTGSNSWALKDPSDLTADNSIDINPADKCIN